jgi:hypothetical protein
MTNTNLLKKKLKKLLWILLITGSWSGITFVTLETMEYRGYHKSTKVPYCSSHMRDLCYGFSQFYLAHGYLLAYTLDEDDKPLHSWRVLLLPYIGEEELYKKIRLNESWDSEYNRQFHDYTIPIYRCPASPNHDKTITNYFLITGNGSLFDKSGKYVDKKSKIFGMNILSDNSLKISTKKILMVEGSKKVHWMCPDDITFDEYESNQFKPATEAHFHLINSDFDIVRLRIAPFYWHWTKLETFLICVLFALCAIVILQICYMVVLLLFCIRSQMIDKK